MLKERDSIEIEIFSLEQQIKYYKNRLLNLSQLMPHDISTYGEFYKYFILASFFAERSEIADEGKDAFQYVYITNDELMATDRFKGIIIKCESIPDDVKNSKIKWDVRSNYAENINRELEEFPDLKGIIEKARSVYKKVPAPVTAKDFYSTFDELEQEEDFYRTCVKLKIADVKIAFNKEYLDTALMCMSEDPFYVYIKDSTSGILMESEEKSIVVMPVRWS